MPSKTRDVLSSNTHWERQSSVGRLGGWKDVERKGHGKWDLIAEGVDT